MYKYKLGEEWMESPAERGLEVQAGSRSSVEAVETFAGTDEDYESPTEPKAAWWGATEV